MKPCVLIGVAAFGLFVLLATDVVAAKLPKTNSRYDLRGSKIYSDLCVDKDTGDVNGLRLFVRRVGQQPRILAQYAEGGLLEPQVATSTVKLGTLKFDFPGDIPEASFSGEVHGNIALVHSRAAGARPFRLVLTSNDDRAPVCR